MHTPPFALALCTLALADAPLPMETPRLPSGVEVPLVQGQPELHPDSNASAGMIKVGRAELDQILSWELPQGELLAATLHERDLVWQALGQPTPADAPAPEATPVAGSSGLRWEVDGGDTFFVGTSWHCLGIRVELTSFGPDTALTRQVHAASLAGAACPAPGGLGMRTD